MWTPVDLVDTLRTTLDIICSAKDQEFDAGYYLIAPLVVEFGDSRESASVIISDQTRYEEVASEDLSRAWFHLQLDTKA
jgi:hypothetical protein